MIYPRVACKVKGTCNQKGPGATCSKCGTKPTGIYWYRFRWQGRFIHETTKSTSKTIAREAERARRRELEESYNHIKKNALPPSFEKAAEAWKKSRENRVAPNTMQIGSNSIKHLLPVFVSKLLCDITSHDIQTYQNSRLKDGAQGRTINIEVQTLRQVLEANKCWRHLEDDVKNLKERKGIGKALTPEQEARLLEECSKSDSACFTAAALALNTTMRSDEVKKLKWEQVDLFEQLLTVGKSKTEAGEERTIPLNPAAVHALAVWAEQFPERQPEHFIFPRCENRLIEPMRPTKGWRTAWRNATKRAGLKLRFHDLRHTAITKLAEGQASDQTIMSIAGHVSRKMLEHYSHIRIAAKRSALDGISSPLPTLEPKRTSLTGVNQNVNQIEENQSGATRKLLI